MNGKIVFSLFLFMLPIVLNAASGMWNSPLAGAPLAYTVTEAESPQKDYNGKYITVVYLENLGFGKIGQDSNAITSPGCWHRVTVSLSWTMPIWVKPFLLQLTKILLPLTMRWKLALFVD
jgi:hypothetical protein